MEVQILGQVTVCKLNASFLTTFSDPILFFFFFFFFFFSRTTKWDNDSNYSIWTGHFRKLYIQSFFTVLYDVSLISED